MMGILALINLFLQLNNSINRGSLGGRVIGSINNALQTLSENMKGRHELEGV
jgi:hypothetical protein